MTEVAETILEEAARLTTRDRHAVYGHPAEDFARTAALWQTILGVEVTPYKFALCMMAVKMSRLVESPEHRDSLVDIAGYANCYQMVVEREAEGS